VHLGADELPFVDLGAGNRLKVLQIREEAGLSITENIFQNALAVQTHRHTGPVFGSTVAGAWMY
jgi:2,4'-dihydroxyacetophenone dioxygenase